MNRDTFPALHLTNEQRRCFLATVASCERFIEQHADSNVPSLQAHLAFCQQHRAKLLAMIEPTGPRRCHIVQCLIRNDSETT